MEALDDPRIDRTKKHSLIDILIIAICSAVSGAKNWVEIEDFGNAKLEWFSMFLDLEHGIPSHDTFRRVFMLLPPDKFTEIFINWVKAVTADKNLKQICVDGKTLRRSFDRGKALSAIHMVNAWSTGVSLSLGQMKSEGKSNEITTVPKLLDLLNVKNCLVSSDAMSCQVKTAEKIIELEGDYLLALKSNQKYLQNRVKEKFIEASKFDKKDFIVDKACSIEKSHGRHEKRICRIIKEKNGKSLGINPLNKWPALNSIIEVESERTNIKTGETNNCKRYYITSSTNSASEILEAVRAHWEVENKLHWVLDVVFREDDCRARTGFGAENFSILRQFALNLIKQEPSKKSIKRKQNLAGWDEDFLLTLLLGNGI